jgi:hypothetical protein
MPSNGKTPAGWSLVRLDSLATVNPDQWSDKTAPETMINYVELGGVEQTGRLFLLQHCSLETHRAGHGEELKRVTFWFPLSGLTSGASPESRTMF